MIQFSLFDNGEFLAPAVLNNTEIIAALQDDELCASVSAEPALVKPHYREREWMFAQAAGVAGSVGVFRSSTYRIRNADNEILRLTAVTVVPLDLTAAVMAKQYADGEAKIQQIVITNKKSGKKKIKLKTKKGGTTPEYTDGSNPDLTLDELMTVECCCVTRPISENGHSPLPARPDGRMYFPMNNLLSQNPEESFLMKHLQRFGFNVILSPSLKGWLKREWFRRQIDNTPLLLPEVQDSRPLFDKLETGLILRCKQATGEFKADTDYVVINTAISEEADDAEGQEVVRLVPVGASYNFKPLEWTAFDGDMAEYFALEYENQVIYDPAECRPNKFPQLFQQYQKRLEKLKLPLFLHTAYDATQIAMGDHAYLGKPMRMGKTREALASSLLWDSKRVGFVSPGIARMDVWDELGRIGRQHEARIVKSVNDLEDGSRFYLMTLPWLKSCHDPLKDQRYEFPVTAVCPHCQEQLMRLTRNPYGKPYWTELWGYRCINKSCTYHTKTKRKHHGSQNHDYDAVPWSATHDVADSVEMVTAKGQAISGGHVDYERAKHIRACVVPVLKQGLEEEEQKKQISEMFRGRQCKGCGFVAQSWRPPRYRRVLKYRWGTTVVDEIHAAKNPSSEQGRAILSLKGKHRLGLTGTLMPNKPQDPYWPLHWMFGGGNYRFPYFRSGDNGLLKWNRDFTKTIEIQSHDEETVKRRALPYLSSPLAFWRLLAPKMVRRSYEDPLVKASLEAAGLYYPTVIPPKTILCDPDPKQAALLLNAMDKFQEHYEQYKAKADKEGKQMKAQTVLAAMSMMKVLATCPDHLNAKLKAAGVDQKIYEGTPGGGKMNDIRNLVWTKVQNGEKVVVLSFYREMLKVLEQELAEFSPVRFDPAWDEEKRYQMRKAFQDSDGPYKVFIAGINTVQVSVDLSAANTVICADLLWTPGLQQQAWSRILQPTPAMRNCEIYLMLLKNSIDRHIYNIFYSKLVAAEQAFDRQVTTKKDKGLDIQWFVDQVMADRPHILEYLIEAGEQEVNYVPMAELPSFEDHEAA